MLLATFYLWFVVEVAEVATVRLLLFFRFLVQYCFSYKNVGKIGEVGKKEALTTAFCCELTNYWFDAVNTHTISNGMFSKCDRQKSILKEVM